MFDPHVPCPDCQLVFQSHRDARKVMIQRWNHRWVTGYCPNCGRLMWMQMVDIYAIDTIEYIARRVSRDGKIPDEAYNELRAVVKKEKRNREIQEKRRARKKVPGTGRLF